MTKIPYWSIHSGSCKQRKRSKSSFTLGKYFRETVYGSKEQQINFFSENKFIMDNNYKPIIIIIIISQFPF